MIITIPLRLKIFFQFVKRLAWQADPPSRQKVHFWHDIRRFKKDFKKQETIRPEPKLKQNDIAEKRIIKLETFHVFFLFDLITTTYVV